MATNKYATIRYNALDKCFSNFGKRFYMEDLIDACDQAISGFSGSNLGIQRRQIFYDINFMESEQGYSAPIEKIRDGRKVFYRYSDKSYSIKNQGLNDNEVEQISSSLSILSRFKGLPNFEWIEEIQVRLEDTFKLKGSSVSFVGFEENPYLKGINHFATLFNAIQNKVALNVTYQGFRQTEPQTLLLHSWYLKQYNNRWFLFAYDSENKRVGNFPIDRILNIEQSQAKFIENQAIDFDEYFDDVIGVTVFDTPNVEKILLKIDKKTWPYIESKPLHGSQKLKSIDDEKVQIELSLQINHELKALLFSHLDAIEVVQPKHLREEFHRISSNIYEKSK